MAISGVSIHFFPLFACLVTVHGANVQFRGVAMHLEVVRRADDKSELRVTYRISVGEQRSTFGYCYANTVASRKLINSDVLMSFNDSLLPNVGENLPLTFRCTNSDTLDGGMTGQGKVSLVVQSTNDVLLSSHGCCWYDKVNSDPKTNAFYKFEAMTSLRTILDVRGHNHSPRSSIALEIRLYQNCLEEIDLRVSDADNDVVKCVEVNESVCQSTCASRDFLVFDSNKCKIVYTGGGKARSYLMNIQMEDYLFPNSSKPLSKVPLQFIITIIKSGMPCSQRPAFTTEVPQEGSTVDVYTLYQERIAVKVPNPVDPILLFITVSPIGMTRGKIIRDGADSDVYFAEFSWYPDASQKGIEPFCFIAVSQSGSSTVQRCISLRVLEIGKCSPGNPCQHLCTNTTLGFQCSCKVGFRSVNVTQCELVDACAAEGKVCDKGAKCVVQNGANRCSCLDGYRGNGTHCQAKPVELMIFFTIANVKFERDLQEQSSLAYRSLSKEVGQKTLTVLKQASVYERLTPRLTIDFEENAKGVDAIIKFQALIPKSKSPVVYHRNVNDALKDAAEKQAFGTLRVITETVYVLSKDYCLSEITGTYSSRGSLSWPVIHVQSTSILPCRYGPHDAYATRRCNSNVLGVALWGAVNEGNCAIGKESTKRLEDLAKTTITEQNAAPIAQEIEGLTKYSYNVTVEDTILIARVFENIVTFKGTSGQVCKVLLETASNVMNINSEAAFTAQLRNGSLNGLVKGISKLTRIVPIDPGNFSKTEFSKRIAVKVFEFEISEFRGGTILVHSSLDSQEAFKEDDIRLENATRGDPNATVWIAVPPTIFSDVRFQNSKRGRISLTVYKDNPLFPSSVKSRFGGFISAKSLGTNSLIVAVDIGLDERFELSNSLEMGFTNRKRADILRQRCVFWNFQEKGQLGGWSTAGCQRVTHNAERSTTKCNCDHLTNFAVLLDPYAGTNVQTVSVAHGKALAVITYVGVGISIAALLFTLLTLALFRDLRKGTHTRVTTQLCLSLLLTLLVFVAVVDRNFTGDACRVSAMILHYLLLVTFAWQLIAALNLYLSFVVVKRSKIDQFMCRALIMAWAFPLLMVGLSAGSFWKYYASDYICVVTKYAAYSFFFGPVFFVISVNIIIAVLVFRALGKPTSLTKNRKQEGKIRVRFVLMSCSLLGLTWAFGALAVGEARLAFQYLFCIFNSLQGFFIFYFQVIRKPMVRQRWRAFLAGKGRNLSATSFSHSSSDFSMKERPFPVPPGDKKEKGKPSDSVCSASGEDEGSGVMNRNYSASFESPKGSE